ncbi:MAG: methyltransferase domain-containing protein, partial [Fimbriimonadaceae bacterium]|nr:methyltransferase domain-containing protein [Chitinophagales bacterium]
MILYIIHKVPFFRKLYFNKIGRPFVEKKIKPILLHLPKNENILDIGSGNGLVTFLLRKKGFNVTPLDIHEGHYNDTVKPIVYDGKKIPFADKSFHTGIILTVLHHTEKPEIVLQEAVRVCKYLIVMEDIYENSFQKYLTFFLDKLANLFYSPCPHTNKTDEG